MSFYSTKEFVIILYIASILILGFIGWYVGSLQNNKEFGMVIGIVIGVGIAFLLQKYVFDNKTTIRDIRGMAVEPRAVREGIRRYREMGTSPIDIRSGRTAEEIRRGETERMTREIMV